MTHPSQRGKCLNGISITVSAIEDLGKIYCVKGLINLHNWFLFNTF